MSKLAAHSVHWGIKPPQKHHPLLSCQAPSLKTANCPSPPFLGNSPFYIGFLWSPPKSQIFQWTPKILKFFILNTILSFLKVTKFLGNISQFKFLVMKEKNIFACKLFLSLNISDFNWFFMWKLHPPPPEKSHPPFPATPL